MKNIASLAGLAFAIVVTDYIKVKLNGSQLDRFPLKKKNKEES